MKKLLVLLLLILPGLLLSQEQPASTEDSPAVKRQIDKTFVAPAGTTRAGALLGSLGSFYADKEEEGGEGNTAEVDTMNSFLPSPQQGYLDAVHSETNVELLNKGLKGQAVLFNIALVQTEPAIAAGFSNANQFAAQLSDRAHHSYELLRDHALNTRTTGSLTALAAFYGCISEQATHSNSSEGLVDYCASEEEPEPASEKSEEAERKEFDFSDLPLAVIYKKQGQAGQ